MIQMEEILKNYKLEDQPQATQDNLAILLNRINQIRAAWNKPMTVTSGLRTPEDQIRVYAAKGITDSTKIPMKSKHLYGQAVDIYDPGLVITAWLKANPDILKDAELWCEEGNSNWVHFQILAPGSGKRWFLP